jgi:hypothetical protein
MLWFAVFPVASCLSRSGLAQGSKIFFEERISLCCRLLSLTDENGRRLMGFAQG